MKVTELQLRTSLTSAKEVGVEARGGKSETAAKLDPVMDSPYYAK